MGIQTTYKCDNNGCGKTSQELDGWFGITVQHVGPVVKASATLFLYGPNANGDHLENGEGLACSESCALAMIQRHMASVRASKGASGGVPSM